MQPNPIPLHAAPAVGPSAEISPIKTEKKYIKGLDFLRAVAALSVCLYHFSGAALPKVTNVYMKPLFANGWLGVDIFFVISGFIIPYSPAGQEVLYQPDWALSGQAHRSYQPAGLCGYGPGTATVVYY